MSGRSEPVLSPIADSELASVDGNRVAVATAVGVVSCRYSTGEGGPLRERSIQPSVTADPTLDVVRIVWESEPDRFHWLAPMSSATSMLMAGGTKDHDDQLLLWRPLLLSPCRGRPTGTRPGGRRRSRAGCGCR